MVQVSRWPLLNSCISKILRCDYVFVQMKRIVSGNRRMVGENDDCCCCGYCCGLGLLLLLLLLPLSAAAAAMVSTEATGIVCSLSPLLPLLLL
mmetsp:Transcript_8052/g.14569  ORF Transcript_8052/g.14569 Transcript_8052/m.14569 type:complete len:93 (-) Transcript_8052:75-353(-)